MVADAVLRCTRSWCWWWCACVRSRLAPPGLPFAKSQPSYLILSHTSSIKQSRYGSLENLYHCHNRKPNSYSTQDHQPTNRPSKPQPIPLVPEVLELTADVNGECIIWIRAPQLHSQFFEQSVGETRSSHEPKVLGTKRRPNERTHDGFHTLSNSTTRS
ncbi:uncharacterized protein EI97DRAFT_216504 [Westerdykella ornata]|uniref:Uncharacterized protein n=1 Tax=Westerdykella ornata TaxID=318751 RepID=A0A6A6JRD2_WESOR|nr:uncharacterized protein EI97DRAFT_216504 [Westerdykella ornata]KAF2278673.1 hypothetical protein EI97DRAFT_216504 [Westerdykella ornata]